MDRQRYVLLDRDGVINHDSDDFIKSPDEWQPIDGSLESIALLNRHGYKVIVISNQSGIARGLFDEEMLASIHDKMHRLLADKDGEIEAIYYCPHSPENNCNCRKPKPGLLNQFALEKNVDLTEVYFVGDTMRDIDAALSTGAIPLLVQTGKGQQTVCAHPDLNIPIFENLYEAAKFIISI
jgi:D-glycero-D-manno-heptose 1,7-bisphosphate phosphatase